MLCMKLKLNNKITQTTLYYYELKKFESGKKKNNDYFLQNAAEKK